ncbi:solute carrier family 4 member 11-like [Glandiceps talaboti]
MTEDSSCNDAACINIESERVEVRTFCVERRIINFGIPYQTQKTGNQPYFKTSTDYHDEAKSPSTTEFFGVSGKDTTDVKGLPSSVRCVEGNDNGDSIRCTWSSRRLNQMSRLNTTQSSIEDGRQSDTSNEEYFECFPAQNVQNEKETLHISKSWKASPRHKFPVYDHHGNKKPGGIIGNKLRSKRNKFITRESSSSSLPSSPWYSESPHFGEVNNASLDISEVELDFIEHDRVNSVDADKSGGDLSSTLNQEDVTGEVKHISQHNTCINSENGKSTSECKNTTKLGDGDLEVSESDSKVKFRENTSESQEPSKETGLEKCTMTDDKGSTCEEVSSKPRSSSIPRPTGGLSVLDLIMGMGRRRAAAINTTGEGGPWQKVRQLVRGISYTKNSMLIHTQRQQMEEKDFCKEIQAVQDIQNFITAKAVFLFDLPNDSFRDVLEPILEQLLRDEPKTSVQEVLDSMFVEKSHAVISNSIQSAVKMGGAFFFEESWICVYNSLQTLQTRHVAIGRLKEPGNLGICCSDITFVIVVLAPAIQKGTRSALQTALTFATIFTDCNFRSEIMNIDNPVDFKEAVHRRTQQLSDMTYIPNLLRRRRSMDHAHNPFAEANMVGKGFSIARGIRADLKRRVSCYFSDFTDGKGVLMTVSFLYFSCLMFTVALGVLNYKNSHGNIGVKKAVVGLAITGLINGFCGGQPLVVLLTSAPLALYTKLVYSVSKDMGVDFMAVYATVGMSSSLFLALYAILDLSKNMKWSTRCVDEVFSIFVACSFLKDAFTDLANNFQEHYSCLWDVEKGTGHNNCTSLLNNFIHAITPAMDINGTNLTTTLSQNVSHNDSLASLAETDISHHDEGGSSCNPENSLLFLLLMIGVPWLGIALNNLNRSPYLARKYREILSDQAIGITVLFWSFVGSYCFRAIQLKPWNYTDQTLFVIPDFSTMTVSAGFFSAFIGFCLSLLIFMDHNIAESLVNAPANNLKKGTSYHWDLFLISVMNFNFALFGFPMVHGKVPHSPMHVKSLSIVEEKVEHGFVEMRTLGVCETRLTTIMAHALIATSVLMLPIPMQYIPQAVLDGIYIFVSVRSLIGNQFFERILLIITEQSAYPPNSYVRRVPQHKIHIFTLIEILELVVMCYLGLNSITYMKMAFPVIVILLIPIRHLLMPKVIEQKYLEALDKH